MKNIEDMDMKELLEQGIASEINAQRKYGAVAKENFAYSLQDKLKFLKKQEKGHEKKLRELFDKHFPDEEPELPQKVLKPAPDIEMDSEAIGELFEEAMESEKESTEFYEHLAERLDDEELKKTARYLSHMEEGHYQILEHELESMEKFKGRWGGIRAF